MLHGITVTLTLAPALLSVRPCMGLFERRRSPSIARQKGDGFNAGEIDAALAGMRDPMWWNGFWEWRVNNASSAHGWAWSNGRDSGNATDWWNVSVEVADVVSRRFPGKHHRILQVGCGDSPLALLLRSNFSRVHNVDVAGQIIERMQLRYPSEKWPGLTFQHVDILEASLPEPFDVVVDKAGAWDYMRKDAKVLARLRSAIKRLLGPAGKYVVVTPQGPREIMLDSPGFSLDGGYDLRSDGTLWAYVLVPSSKTPDEL